MAINIRSRDDMLNYVKVLSHNSFRLTFKDRIFGNFAKKFYLLRNSLITAIKNNIKVEENIEFYLREIGNIDEYNTFLEEEMKNKLFDNLNFFPSIVQHRTEARTIVNKEVDRVMTLLQNKMLNFTDAVYFPVIGEKLKDVNSEEIIESLKSLIEIENQYNNILSLKSTVLYQVIHQNPILRFNKKLKDGKNIGYTDGLTQEVSDFLGYGFGIAGDLETLERRLKVLKEEVNTFSANEKIKK